MNILITGGASGLGEAITRKLAEDQNHFVYFTYCNSQNNARSLEEQFPNTRGIHCDFRNNDSVNKLCNEFQDLGINILVNNAFSLSPITHFHKNEKSLFSSSFDVNIVPSIFIMQKAVEIFRKAKYGKVITILSSALVNKPPIGWSVYTAEKNYLLSICKSIAVENASFNITSNCVSPSFMHTEMTRQTDERIIEEMKNKHPLKRLLTTAETAESVSFLVNASQQINGTNMIINSASDIV
jgi:NAD(P)-dependent dehydrogenase (short-subunit alcohol dehydrogenase family)